MLKTADKLVRIGLLEVGYTEKETNSNLDSKTANAGDGNYTKYARDLYKAGFFNGNKNGYDWCTTFVTWCAWKCCDENTAEAEKLLCQMGDLAASCTYASRYYKSANRWFTTPEVGDQIFFWEGGSMCHTGIVADFDGKTVTTVEGNYSNKVVKRTYKVGDSYIAGYGRPLYDVIIKGDVNGDGKVNAADASKVLAATVGKVELTEKEQAAADVTGDGKVNAADASKILAASVGKVEL